MFSRLGLGRAAGSLCLSVHPSLHLLLPWTLPQGRCCRGYQGCCLHIPTLMERIPWGTVALGLGEGPWSSMGTVTGTSAVSLPTAELAGGDSKAPAYSGTCCLQESLPCSVPQFPHLHRSVLARRCSLPATGLLPGPACLLSALRC